MEENCSVCGNSYHKMLVIKYGDKEEMFDSFECAIHGLAPICSNCGLRVVGHGVEFKRGKIYCCDHCAHQNGENKVRKLGGLIDA